MENGFEWPGLLSALVLAQHADQHRPERPVLLAVEQEPSDRRVRFDPLDPKTNRHAGECEFASADDPSMLWVLLKVKPGLGLGYDWVECGGCGAGWQVPH